METQKPNFLIVGAAKSGTTSLYYYLNEHPQIFMPKLKEPLYFISDSVKYHTVDPWTKKAIAKHPEGKPYIDNWEDYINLFKDSNEAIAIGEASATYLYYYQESVPRIKKELGDIKIIIILRDPVKKAFSQYKYLKKGNAEPLKFSDGITQEDKRISQNYSTLYHYTKQGFYYEQVKAFLKNFTSVKIILLEDLNTNPQNILNEISDYLGIEKFTNYSSFQKHNTTDYVPKYHKLNAFFNTPALKYVRKKIMENIFPKIYLKSKELFLNLNSANFKLNSTVENNLKALFKEDVEKLELLINRDLSKWK